jgi:P27 family predicted phage terminase small subunit
MKRGPKPKLTNVIPMTGAGAPRGKGQSVAQAVTRMRPKKMPEDLRKEWDRVARLLAEPTVDRLKPRFVDTITEYCRATLRLRYLREAMPQLNTEIYRVEAGRNGTQIKQHPYVGQLHETWREWRTLVAMLGLSPADERNLNSWTG